MGLFLNFSRVHMIDVGRKDNILAIMKWTANGDGKRFAKRTMSHLQIFVVPELSEASVEYSKYGLSLTVMDSI